MRDVKADGITLTSKSFGVAFGAVLIVFLVFQFICAPGFDSISVAVAQINLKHALQSADRSLAAVMAQTH